MTKEHLTIERLALVAVLLLSGCAQSTEPSDQCRFEWGWRAKIQQAEKDGTMKPYTIAEMGLHDQIMEHAKECDAHPSMVWL